MIITFATPADGEDSYGIDKVDLYGYAEADVTGWTVCILKLSKSTKKHQK